MTPIQQAIAELELKIEKEHYSIAIAALYDAISILKQMLPHERHTIEQAFKDGAISGKSMAHNGYAEYENSSDYFTKKYDTK